MPDQTSNVGPLTIPLPAQGAYTPIADPTIAGFLDYFRFWIRDGLTQKIDDPNDTQPDPLPEGNLFDYDPMGNWVRNVDDDAAVDDEESYLLPALYIWQASPSVTREWTMTYDMRERKLRVMYVAKPIFGPLGTRMFSGLGSAVDAILLKSWSRGLHPDYGYDDAARGTRIAASLNLLGWKWEGGQPGMMAPVPGTSPRVGGPSDGNLIHYYPAMLGTMTVWERVDQETLTTADQAIDIPFAININDPADVRGPLTIMDRYLISASEAEDSGE